MTEKLCKLQGKFAKKSVVGMHSAENSDENFLLIYWI